MSNSDDSRILRDGKVLPSGSKAARPRVPGWREIIDTYEALPPEQQNVKAVEAYLETQGYVASWRVKDVLTATIMREIRCEDEVIRTADFLNMILAFKDDEVLGQVDALTTNFIDDLIEGVECEESETSNALNRIRCALQRIFHLHACRVELKRQLDHLESKDLRRKAELEDDVPL